MNSQRGPVVSMYPSAAQAPGTPRPPHPEAAQRRVLRALRVAQAFGGIGQAAGGSAGALLARHITGSDAQAGWPQASLTAGAAVAAVIVSAVARRTTRRRSLAGALMAGTLGAGLGAASAAAHSLALLLLGCVLLGAGNAAVMLARYAATDLAQPGQRGRAIAAVLVATSVGAVLGANLLGATAPIAASVGVTMWAGPYLAAAVTYALACGLVLIGLRPDPLTLARRIDHADAASSVARSWPRRQILPRGSVGGFVTIAAANLVMMALMTLAPLELVAMGQGLGVVGMIVSLHIAAMFAPSPISGRLADRFGGDRTAALGALLLAAASVTAVMNTHDTATLATALILLGTGWNVAVVAGSTMLTAGIAPQRRPRLEATGEVGMGVAGAAGSAVSGPIVLASGYTGLGIACAVVSAALVLVLAIELRRPGITRPAPADTASPIRQQAAVPPLRVQER